MYYIKDNPYAQYIRSYKDVRFFYNLLHDYRNMGIELPPDTIHMIDQAARKNVYSRPGYDPLRKPLSEAWRTYSDDDGESATDYRILPDRPDDPYTDEEIREYIEDSEVYYGRINSPYDCTGRRFTRSYSFRRTPAGIVLLHHWGLDV